MKKLFANAAILSLLVSPALAGDSMEIRWSGTIAGDKYSVILKDANQQQLGHYTIEISGDTSDSVDLRGAHSVCFDAWEGSRPISQVAIKGEGAMVFIVPVDPDTGLFCPEVAPRMDVSAY